MEAQAVEIGAEARLRAGHPEVGHQRESEAAADRGAVHRGDDRLARAKQAHRFLVKVLAGALRRGPGRRAVREIGAGAERLAFGGEHDRAALRVAIEGIESVADLCDEGIVEEIVRRPADLDRPDPILPFDAHVIGGCGHGLVCVRSIPIGKGSAKTMHEFRFEPVRLPPAAEQLRGEVREFLAAEQARGAFTPSRNSWNSFDPDFSRKCGARGYIGMRWPKGYGGHERSALERYVVTEEMLAGGAPVGAHWIADRQSGHQILGHGSERARRELLPRIAAGDCYFAIGMSEPDSGSDLAAVRTRATKVDGGWKINGTKVWTSNAHQTHYMITLARTAPKEEDRHAGLTQFIVELGRPGVEVRPIHNLYGGHDFNQVIYDDCFVADDMLIGEPGAGWRMVTGELAFERSGPDRFLSTYQLLLASIRALGPQPGERAANEIGRFVAHLATLRRMSTSVAGML